MIATLLVIALGSCTVSPPRVVDTRVEVQLIDDRDIDLQYQQLSAFVLAEDADGLSDLEFLYVIHDASDLYWQLNAETWQRIEQEGETWVGSSGLTMADYSPLRSGTYRLLLVDLAGERDEREVMVDAPVDAADPSDFPSLTQERETITVQAPVEEVTLRVFENRGRRRRTHSAPVGTYELTEVFTDGTLSGSSLFLELPPVDGRGYRLISGPYRP
ncbi:MAG: hypothetical protein GVY29_08285 [Spirochaetes bacterium]|nr:hypothetical protein [Spirochaetota bacterium]